MRSPRASDIPYTGAPEVEPTAAPPPDYQRLEVNPRMFGAGVGQGLEELGQGALKASEAFGQISADEQANFFLDNVDQEVTQFRQLKGRDAMEAYPALTSRLQDLANEARGNLSTPAQRLMFDQQTRYLMRHALSEAGGHYDTQQQIWAGGVAAGGANLALRGIAGNPLNDDAFNHNTADLMNFRLRQAAAKFGNAGLTPEITDSVLGEARQEAAAARIEALLPTDPVRAGQILDQEKDNLKGPLYDKLAGKVKAHGDSTLGNAVANEYIYGRAPSGRMSVGGAIEGRGAEAVTAPEQYRGLIGDASSRYNVPADLLTRVLHAESGFNPNAVGPPNRSGELAQGIAQFLPSTASQYGINPRDPAQAIDGAAHYLSDLHEQRGSWKAAVDGYLGGNSLHVASYVRSGVPQLAASLDGGKTEPAAATAQPIPPPPAAPTTPIAQPPGMEELAQAQLQAVQQYEHAMTGIENDPRLADRPDALKHAQSAAEAWLRGRTLDISARRQILTEQHNAALDGYVKRMAPGQPLDPSMTAEIAADPHLGPQERENLYRVLETRQKGTVEQGLATNGPGYFDVRRRMLLPQGDPDRISDPSQLIALGVPDEQGHVWLTDSGIRALMPEMAALKKDPDRVSSLRRLQQFFDGVKQRIVREWPGAPADPAQLQRYADFQLMVEKKWDQAKDEKDREALITRGTPNYQGSDDVLKGFVKQDDVLGVKPGGVDLTTQASIVAAYRGGKINYDQAVEALQKGKFVAAPPPPEPTAPLAQP